MLVYREMTQEDIPACAELEIECFSQPWSPEALESAMKIGNTAFFVGENEGEIVGYGGVQCFAPDGAVTNIAVCENCRGRGIGKGILKCLLDHCEKIGINNLTLEVRLSNTPAIKLYENHGFKILGIRKGFYANPVEDAYIMQKKVGL